MVVGPGAVEVVEVVDQRGTVGVHEKIEKKLALRRQQRRVDRTVRRQSIQVIADQALQKWRRILAGKPQAGAIFEQCGRRHRRG